MANIPWRLLFAHWLAFLEAWQRIFWNYIPQPLLSTVFPGLIEDGPKFPPIVRVPRTRDPSDCGNFVDLAMTCPVPTFLRTPLVMNFTCSVDHSNVDLEDASSAELPRYNVFLDIPVWAPAVLHKDKPLALLSAQVGDDRAQTNMVLYGARGLSFCPVLVGIVYVQSLLHLYMLLMIPSLLNHWVEDVLVYESLNPIELLGCSWYLHTSLWIAPWCLLRYGVRNAVPSLCRHFRRVSYKQVHPPIPRIVLIRVDGEAVPVNFVEDHRASVDIGVWSDVAFNSGEHQDFTQFVHDEGCVVTEYEASPTRAVSHQGGIIAETSNGIKLGSLTSDFAEGSQLFVSQIHDERMPEISPAEAANEYLQSVRQCVLVLPKSGLAALVATPSDRNINEETDKFGQVTFPKAKVLHEGGADSLGESEDSDQDATFSPWNLVDEYGPDDSAPPSEAMTTTSSSVGLQDSPIPVKNVRFAIGDDAGAAGRCQISLSASHVDGYTCARNVESQRGEDVIISVHIPVVPFDSSMDKEDVPPREETKSVLPTLFSEERVEENDIVLAESFSPPLTRRPVVNLPSLVATREAMRFMEMDPVVSEALIEDVATRSPLQTLSPLTPAVVINMKCIMEVGEHSWALLATEGLDQGLPHPGHSFDWVGTLNDKPAACTTLDIVVVPPRENMSYSRSPSIEGVTSHSSPTNDELLLGDVRALEIPLSAPAAVSEINMPLASTGPVATNASPSAVMEVPGTYGAEILYETPRYYSNEKDLGRSPRNELRGPEFSIPDAASAGIHLPAVSKSSKEPSLEDQGNFGAVEKSNSMTITLAGQPVWPSGPLETGLPTTEPSERRPLLSDTCKDASPLSIISAEKKIGEIDHGESVEGDAIPWDCPDTTSKPSPERTLSGSIHAPPEHLRIPQTNSHIERTSVLETPPFVAHSTSLARPDEGNGTRMTTEDTSKHKQDLSASIHAPQKLSEPEVQSSVSETRDESHGDHRRSATNPVVVSERKPTKPCLPNWAAIPEVVDAFCMFKQAPRRNTTRRTSSIADCTNRGPMLKVVGQKGTTTNSLNSTSATANIQSRWRHGSGLKLVRDPVTSDPSDFNLRTCTKLRTSKIHAVSTISARQVPYPGVLDIPTYALQHGIAPYPVRVNVNFSSMVAGPTGTQPQQSVLVPHNAETGPTLVSQRWMTYRG